VNAPQPTNLVFHDRGTFEARSFWQRLLFPPPPRSGLRADFRSTGSARLSVEEIELTAATREHLLRITRDSELLVQAVLSAAVAVVLSRYNDLPAAVLGCSAGEGKGKALLPVVLTVDATQSFKALLLRARQSILDARAHGDYPWRTLLSADEAPAAASPWSVAVACEPPDGADLADLDAMIVAEVAGGQRRIRILHDANRFAAATVAQFGRHVAAFVAQALAAIDREIAALPLMDARERERVLVEWNDTAKPLPETATFNHLFQQQLARHPEREALVAGAGRWTYAEVDRATERLARHLRARGCGPGDIVGVCLPASALRIIALLAILRAGAAFLPLDPDYPVDRLTFMVGDADVRLLLMSGDLRAELGDLGAARVADPAALIDEAIEETSGKAAGPDDPAYVIYTSGSTGQPKGAVIRHRGLVNLILEQIRLFRVEPASRVLQFASFSFDAAVSEIGMALCCGGALYVSEREEMLPGKPLATMLHELEISHVTLPPSSLSAMPDVVLPHLRTLIVAGEPCPAALVDRWAPGRLFINGYGPTECTVGVTFATCEAGVARPPIGQLIANTRAYVLAASGEPQPIGVPGELHIGGVGLAQGYLKRPELTAAKFVRDPFSDDPRARLYRTGDLVRWLPDGSLDFVGRIDDQVKLRGYRIEPSEIESAIAAHAGVREASVVVRPDRRGEPQLVAFVVAREAADTPDLGELRQHVGARLPQHMIPQAFVFLDALPQTPNLKVDRMALARLTIEEATPTAGVMPRDSVELALQRIWESALERSPIGVTDNFFELGGYSMLAVRLMAEIEEQLGRRLHVNILFAAPTIEGLAVALREGAEPHPWTPVVSLRAAGRKPPLWIVHPAGGTTFCYGSLAVELGVDQPVHTLQAIGMEPGQQPLATVEEMASLYLAAMRRQQPAGPWLLAGWSFGGLVAHEIALRLEREGTPPAFVGLIDTFAPAILPTALRDLDDAQNLVNLFGKDIPLETDELRSLSAEAQLAHVLDLARRADLVPPDFDMDQAGRLLALYNANAAAVFSYRPAPLSGRVHLFRARTLPPGPAGAVAESAAELGWQAGGGVEVAWLEGDHQSILRPPAVAALARAIAAGIDEALSGKGPGRS
jgi:amino acid adenylation domain-containing protein